MWRYFNLKMEEFKIKKYQHIKLIIALLGLLYWPGELFSQENTDAAGGNAYGTGGTVSYSIGQLDYLTATGPGGTITDGVQQPYEIMIVSGIEDTTIKLALSVYPNPATDIVTLSVENSNTRDMAYHLYDLQGKIIQSKKLDGSQTLITLTELSNNIYFIKVLVKDNEVKTFKIIKNK